MTSPVWITPAGFLFTATEQASVDFNFRTTGLGVNYRVISGSLPEGITLFSNGYLNGFPSNVNNTIKSTFVIRAENVNGIRDRTFSIDVIGTDAPTWLTLDKYLRVGIDNEQYALNNQWVDFQFQAIPTQSKSNTTITYYIANGDGKLPPGLQLDASGRLYGYIKDNLGLNDSVDPGNGYDFRSYDTASYDYFFPTNPPTTHVPKLYQFRVTASDGIEISKKIFTIVVTDMDVLKNNIVSMPIDISFPSVITYLQKAQFLLDSNLGTIRANNHHIISIGAYNPEPLIGTLTYILNGDLPEGLYLDSQTGYIYGYVPYQPAYTLEYDFEITARKTLNNVISSKSKNFKIKVKGDVESSIEWVTETNLGTLETGQPCELSIEAKQINSEYNIKYSIVDGNLPLGLSFKQDGSISGSISYGTTGTFSFSVRASDVYNLSAIEKSFTLNVTASDREYTKIYIKPFLTKDKRKIFANFISDTTIFPPRLIYRYFDPNFGVQNEIKCILEFGIEKINLRDYTVALRENFYRRKFTLGKPKLAIAKNEKKEILYEVIYVDIIDNLVNNQNTSVSHVIYANNEIYYPASIDNMRRNLEMLVLPDYTFINIKDNYQPKFMQTAQEGEYKTPGYMRVMPICYALPGQGLKIIERIKLSGFQFNMINFDVDRLVIENSADNTSAKYLLFTRDSITEFIETDDYLFGPEGFIRLEKEDEDPLIRE